MILGGGGGGVTHGRESSIMAKGELWERSGQEGEKRQKCQREKYSIGRGQTMTIQGRDNLEGREKGESGSPYCVTYASKKTTKPSYIKTQKTPLRIGIGDGALRTCRLSRGRVGDCGEKKENRAGEGKKPRTWFSLKKSSGIREEEWFKQLHGHNFLGQKGRPYALMKQLQIEEKRAGETWSGKNVRGSFGQGEGEVRKKTGNRN